MEVKSSAIPYSGYDYQTLQGLLILSLWLNNPSWYKRICFEADNDAPQGIDDIVCERADGKTDYIQVKFTPSPDKDANAFSWDWLLIRTGKTNRSRSILKKLSDAIIEVGTDKLGNVILVTNKIPDRDIETCLKDGKINYDLVQPEIQAKIIEQLGNENIVKSFFVTLQIQHSEGGYHSILRNVQSELEKHSDDDGIARLKNRAREWAIFKNLPSKNGWIELHHIRAILSLKRPEPIPQSFSIPDNYSVPDDTFHEVMLNQICDSPGEVIVLTGEPGKGKSTYLSHLCNELEEKNIPIIRHHYFLSINDQTNDRFSPRIIANSLLLQISSDHQGVGFSSSNSTDLKTGLEQCAIHYKAKGKPFVLIVDGLDHVWRDNDRNKKPLDYFFRELLPLPDNLVLLVGTQPVDDSMLPDILLEYSDKNKWRWIPSMTGNSIYKYLHYQIDSGRLHMICHEDMIEVELKKVAEELVQITSGYPLHVIYSCEYIINKGEPLSAWTVKNLPPCKSSNIDSYYLSLWRRLTYKQKDILHLCCGFQFIWPRDAFIPVLDDSLNDQPSLNAVSHLLFESKSGVRPFHESLIVFVRRQAEHDSRISNLVENVCTWLNNQAPEHLNYSWYWLCISKSGNSQPLRCGVTRDWTLDRLSEGYGTQTAIRLLGEAESVAFNELNFAEAYKHRALKTRLLNGPEFQTWNFPTLEILSLIEAPESLVDLEFSLHRDKTPKKSATLSIALWYRDDLNNAKIVAKKAIDKHKSQSKLYRQEHRDEEEEESKLLIKAGVLSDVLNYNIVFEKDNFENWPDGYVTTFKEACLLKGDIPLLMKVFSSLNIGHLANDTELSILRISILEDFDAFAWHEFQEHSSHTATELLTLLKEMDFKLVEDSFPDINICKSYKYTNDINYYEWFFKAVVIKLKAQGDFSWLLAKANKERVDISFYLNKLTVLASHVAELLAIDGEINFFCISSMLQSISFPEDSHYDSKRATILFKREWLKISADLHLLTTKKTIDIAELQEVIDNEIYLLDWIRLWYSDIVLNLLSDDAAKLLIECVIDKQSKELEETIERSNNDLELANIAFRHHHEELFIKTIRLCWDYVIGYGHHKDTTIFNVLHGIEYLADVNSTEALSCLKKITPIVFNIGGFTDGDETRHSLSTMSELLSKLSPSTLASKYDQEVRDGEWYDADTSLEILLDNSDFNSPILKRLCLTGLSKKCEYAIFKRSMLGDIEAKVIVNDIKNHMGLDIIEEEQKETFTDKIDIDPAFYPPSDFLQLEEALKGKYSTKIFWLDWYSYWVDKGKEQDLVELFSSQLSTINDNMSDKRYLLEPLFLSNKKFVGKSKAFKYLIAAQITLNGWADWYEKREDSLNRLKIVAEIYTRRINEFILESTNKPDTWYAKIGDLIIPNDKLVFLLVQSGRIEEALNLVNAMIDMIEEDTRNLNLKPPDWIWSKTRYSNDEVFMKILVSRLKWPVPTIKLLVSQHLSEMLAETNEMLETHLLTELASCKLESECIEILSVFLMAKELGYKPSIEIGKFINARSILSDMLIEELELTENGNFSTDFSPIVITSSEDSSFNKVQGRDIPLLYKSTLEYEEKNTGIPFVDYYKSEWNKTFEYVPSNNNDINYFLGSEREQNTGQFYTSNGHRGRSAFLRTIEIGRQYFDMPDSYAENLAIKALPIEPVYNSLRSNKPSWIHDWTYGDSIVDVNLSEYLTKCISSMKTCDENNELGALSFPVQIDKNTWLELSIIKAVCNAEIPSGCTLKSKSHGYSITEKLNQKISYICNDIELEEIEDIIPLADSSYPFSRYGHWYSDLESRGVNIPLTYDEEKIINAISSNNKLQFYIGKHIIGDFGYWNHKWAPTHPKGINSLYGTFTTFSKSSINHWMNNKFSGFKNIYVCKAILLQRDREYSEYTSKENTLIVSDIIE